MSLRSDACLVLLKYVRININHHANGMALVYKYQIAIGKQQNILFLLYYSQKTFLVFLST